MFNKLIAIVCCVLLSACLKNNKQIANNLQQKYNNLYIKVIGKLEHRKFFIKTLKTQLMLNNIISVENNNHNNKLNIFATLTVEIKNKTTISWNLKNKNTNKTILTQIMGSNIDWQNTNSDLTLKNIAFGLQNIIYQNNNINDKLISIYIKSNLSKNNQVIFADELKNQLSGMDIIIGKENYGDINKNIIQNHQKLLFIKLWLFKKTSKLQVIWKYYTNNHLKRKIIQTNKIPNNFFEKWKKISTVINKAGILNLYYYFLNDKNNNTKELLIPNTFNLLNK